MTVAKTRLMSVLQQPCYNVICCDQVCCSVTWARVTVIQFESRAQGDWGALHLHLFPCRNLELQGRKTWARQDVTLWARPREDLVVLKMWENIASVATQQLWASLQRLHWGLGKNKAALSHRAGREDGKAGVDGCTWAFPSPAAPVRTAQATEPTDPPTLEPHWKDCFKEGTKGLIRCNQQLLVSFLSPNGAASLTLTVILLVHSWLASKSPHLVLQC